MKHPKVKRSASGLCFDLCLFCVIRIITQLISRSGVIFTAQNTDFLCFVKIPGIKTVTRSRILPARTANSCQQSLKKPNIICSSSSDQSFCSVVLLLKRRLFSDQPVACSNSISWLRCKQCLYLHCSSVARGRLTYYCWFMYSIIIIIIISYEVQSWPQPSWHCGYVEEARRRAHLWPFSQAVSLFAS